MIQFLDPPEQYTHADSSAVRIIPVPYDGTSTYRKGADRGPDALLEASGQVETSTSRPNPRCTCTASTPRHPWCARPHPRTWPPWSGPAWPRR